MITKKDNYLSLPAFARSFDVDIKAVRRMCDKGLLTGIMIDRLIFIDLDSMTGEATAEGLTLEALIRYRSRQSSAYR